MPFRAASTSATVVLVRASEAPLGSWMPRIAKPWSSSGRKPVGRRTKPVAPSPSTPKNSSTVTNLCRIMKPTVAVWPVVSAPNPRLNQRNRKNLGGCGLRRRMAHKAGVRVSALIADSAVDEASTSANCWYIWPVMPGRKVAGTNTDISVRVTPAMAPPSSSMALIAASFGPQSSSSMIRQTFSTTTIASSTTMAMASTRPNSEIRLSVRPKAASREKVPTSETGMVMVGISVPRQSWRKMKMVRKTRTPASSSVWITPWIASFTKIVVSNRIV